MIATTRFQLDNGLRVIHNFDGTTAMVAVNILYDVGARDEDPEMTGLAHLFEHLMFGGSVNVPDFDGALELAGGKNNAWTSNDFTNFYDIVPAQNVETAFWLESDRMLGLAFSDKALEVQRSVVIEEFKQQFLNRPYGDQMAALRQLAYTVHPYRYPVIGREISHIEKVTQEDVRRFFYSHYAPNNAVLAVSGNITAAETRRLTEKWFGPIPRREVVGRSYAQEPLQTEARRMEVVRDVPSSAISLAYPMSGYGTEEYFAADLLTDLLANGESSRFYRKLLMQTGLFTAVDASIVGSEEPGLMLFNAKLSHNDAEHERLAVEAILETVDDLRHTISEREIVRAVNRNESQLTFGYVTCLNKAMSLAQHEYHGTDINAEIAPYRALTPDRLLHHLDSIVHPDRANLLLYRATQ